MRGGAVLVVLLAASSCGGPETEEELETSNPVAVTVALASTGPIRAVVHAPGRVTPGPGGELSVIAPEACSVAELPYAEGDRVRRGELLVRFHVPALTADVEARRGEVARAQARVQTARQAVTRLEGLFDRGVAARKEIEEARRDAAEAEADLASANGGLTGALDLLDRTVVKAPFDGVVIERLHHPGDLVDAGGAVLKLVDPGRLQVEAAVPITDLVQIEIGQPVEIRGPGLVTPIAGSVAGMPGAADPATGSAKVRIALGGATSLPVNATVEVDISTAEHAAGILVPAQAVVEDAGGAFVFVVDAEQRAHRRAIETGISSGHQLEVRSGIDAGERVIVAGQNALPDGAAVTPRLEAAAP